MKDGWKDKLEKLKVFFKSSLEPAQSARVVAYDEIDAFLLLCFSDALGIPNPYSYYMSELLPYIAEDLPAWENRMVSDRLEGLQHLASDKLEQHTL
ncbi:hypothetical protein C9439_04475 [archaeon SCG-AAA382B04]|nr:hypothetical protein C9439_04475 [archaeon SCG-AAA382B04]